MEAWQDRVIAEKRELDEKIVKLAEFISGNASFDVLPTEERGLLRAQRDTMLDYSDILKQRIDRF